MKVGTVPKITGGVVAIVILVFIGTRQFISSKEDSPPSVEVVTSTPNQTANSVAQEVATRKGSVTALSREDKPQISAEEMGQIEDFFAQLDEADPQSEADTSQLATDEASNQNSKSGNVTESSIESENTVQSAEEVMNAYVDAFRNVNFEAMRALLTGTAKENLESRLSDLKNKFTELTEIYENEANPVLKRMFELTLDRVLGGFEVVSSEYVGDEFHFRVRTLTPQIEALIEPLMPVMRDMPEELRAELPETEIPELPESIENVFKMRKEDGVWLIYENGS